MIPMGTRSLLIGAHHLLIHPLFVALAWTRLYGLPRDPRLWLAFFLHDLGYLGKPCMDDARGETHPELGARIMRRLCGEPWAELCLYHSRSYARAAGHPPSALNAADKLAFALEPRALYLPRVILTGEIHEYLARAGGQPGSKYGQDGPALSGTLWHRACTWHAWATAHSRQAALDAHRHLHA